MLILTVQFSCGNIGLLGRGVMATEPHSNSFLQQVQLPQKETYLPTQPGTGNSAEMPLIYERSELQIWIAEALLCRLECMDTDTHPAASGKQGWILRSILTYPFLGINVLFVMLMVLKHQYGSKSSKTWPVLTVSKQNKEGRHTDTFLKCALPR